MVGQHNLLLQCLEKNEKKWRKGNSCNGRKNSEDSPINIVHLTVCSSTWNHLIMFIYHFPSYFSFSCWLRLQRKEAANITRRSGEERINDFNRRDEILLVVISYLQRDSLFLPSFLVALSVFVYVISCRRSFFCFFFIRTTMQLVSKWYIIKVQFTSMHTYNKHS